VLPADEKGLLFRAHGGNGDVLFRFETVEAPGRLVARIADPSLPFGGSWTYELQQNGAGTALTITEDGEVYNPIFRVMQKLFFSAYQTIDTYLQLSVFTCALNAASRGPRQPPIVSGIGRTG
jgi:hypothetical protein